MDRTRKTRLTTRLTPLALCVMAVASSTGCQVLMTGIYIWEGGNMVDGESDALDGQRVVVFCRPPASNEYRHAGASRQIAERIGAEIEINGADIEVVDRREVDNWTDENGGDNPKQLARALQATRLLEIEIDHFDLFKGKTLYQGNADVVVTVYDMTDGGKRVWDKPLGEVLFPRNSGIPVQDKSLKQFQREFVDILSEEIARHFYRHDPTADWAIDALANK